MVQLDKLWDHKYLGIQALVCEIGNLLKRPTNDNNYKLNHLQLHLLELLPKILSDLT